ncbi:hypothetical protein Q4I30_007576 [Leishmania utingensis]|uniref:Uncharacterized protein n=1 Tax=Leishmania utingensis TaxID=653362 RepID=A0AAW3A0Z1_9TRYP
MKATTPAPSASLCSALETALSCCYGRDQTSKLFEVYAQCMVHIPLTVVALVDPVLEFSDSLLISSRQNAQVPHFTGQC